MGLGYGSQGVLRPATTVSHRCCPESGSEGLDPVLRQLQKLESVIERNGEGEHHH